MPEQTTSTRGGDGSAEAAKVIFFIALAVVVVLIIIYTAIFAMAGAAVYFGVKLGAYPWWSTDTEPYHQVHRIEAAKRLHLKALKGESEELQNLVEEQFEEKKLALYRPKDDTHQPPHKELAMEFAKAAMKHAAAALFKGGA
jgi:hypothetical protein